MTTLKFINPTIGFQELKNETSLIVAVTNCPNQCKSCHSPHLRSDFGQELTELNSVIDKYIKHITAICFLGHGNDAQQDQFTEILRGIRNSYPELNLGLYSGSNIMELDFMEHLDYYKIGEYIEEFGGLESPITNQTMYTLKDGAVTGTIKYY